MKDKDVDRIKGLYMQRFKSIIMTIVVMLYEYGYHLFPNDDYNKKDILIELLNAMFDESELSYLLFDKETFKLYRIELTKLNIIDIQFNDEEDYDGAFIINVDTDIDADAYFTLYEERGIDDEVINYLVHLHTVTSEKFSKCNFYFKEIIPNTNPKFYHPCDELTPFDFVLMVNMVNFVDFVSYNIAMLHSLCPGVCILDDGRVVIPREQLMSINIFLQDIARKISILEFNRYDKYINLVYSVPVIDYSDVAIDDYAKNSLIGNRNVKLDKYDYVVGEYGIAVTYSKLAILTYQNS